MAAIWLNSPELHGIWNEVEKCVYQYCLLSPAFLSHRCHVCSKNHSQKTKQNLTTMQREVTRHWLSLHLKILWMCNDHMVGSLWSKLKLNRRQEGFKRKMRLIDSNSRPAVPKKAWKPRWPWGARSRRRRGSRWGARWCWGARRRRRRRARGSIAARSRWGRPGPPWMATGNSPERRSKVTSLEYHGGRLVKSTLGHFSRKRVKFLTREKSPGEKYRPVSLPALIQSHRQVFSSSFSPPTPITEFTFSQLLPLSPLHSDTWPDHERCDLPVSSNLNL